MGQSFIPAGYAPHLSLYETQSAISLIKRAFQDALSRELNLRRVSAPLFVEPSSGLNDDLNGVERPVGFDIPCAHANAQVVHSLAKWKRMALYRYDIHPGKGIYTDMNAIRRDETTDNIHSIFRRSVGLGKDHRQKGPQPGNLKGNRLRRLQGAAQNGNVHGDPV